MIKKRGIKTEEKNINKTDFILCKNGMPFLTSQNTTVTEQLASVKHICTVLITIVEQLSWLIEMAHKLCFQNIQTILVFHIKYFTQLCLTEDTLYFSLLILSREIV